MPTMKLGKTYMNTVAVVDEPDAIQNKGRILVIDKPQFSAMIRKMLSTQYDIVCVDDIASGFLQLSQGHFDAVVVDKDVRGGGLQLAECLKMNPTLGNLPVVLTCIQPREDWVQQVKLRGIAQVVAKPFRPSTLMALLEVTIKKNRAKTPVHTVNTFMQVIDKRISQLDHILPKKPEFGLQVTDDGLFSLLSRDRSIQDAVLTLANSASESRWRKIDSARLAINMMGMPETKRLLQCIGVIRCLKEYAPDTRFNLAAWSKNAIGGALIARAFGKSVGLDEDTCFLGGLLHDVGKIILDQAFPSAYSGVRDSVFKEKISYHQAEQEFLGFSHGFVGGFLAHKWSLGEDLAEGIICHHDVSLARQHARMAAVLFLSDAIGTYLNFGSSGEMKKVDAADPEFLKAYLKLGFTHKAFESLVETGRKELKYAQVLVEAVFKRGV